MTVGGKRILDFNPSEDFICKNPAQLPPLEVPSFAEHPDFLAQIIASIKASLQQISETGQALQQHITSLIASVETAKTAAAIQKVVDKANAELADEPAGLRQVKQAVLERIDAIDVEFDENTGKFVKRKQAA